MGSVLRLRSVRVKRLAPGILGAALIVLLAAADALGDVAPDPRRARGPDSVSGNWLIVAGLCAFFLLVARLVVVLMRESRDRNGEPGEAGGTAGSETDPRSSRKRSTPAVVIAAVALLLLGAVALVAVPNFLNFRLKAKTSEARSNLGAIRSTEMAFFAEWGVYVGNQPPTPQIDPGNPARWRVWDNHTRFSILGFAADGPCYCSYALEGPDFPDEKQGFVARAECDLDGDGKRSVHVITHRSAEIVQVVGGY